MRVSPFVRLGIATLVLAVGSAASANAAWAQGGVADAEIRYREAVAEYETNRNAMESTSLAWELALERVANARGTDNEESARAASHAAAIELMELERATQESSQRVEATRIGWIRALEAREMQILEQGGNAPGALGQRLVEELLQVRRRIVALEAEAGVGQTVTLRPVPELSADPRDGIDDLRAKQDLMEEQVARYDSLITDIDSEIGDLQTRLQRNQSVEDFLRSVQRFGSDLVSGAPLPPPVSGQNTDGSDGAVTGTDGGVEAALASRPLEERIDILRGIRTLAVQYRDQAVEMANTFRDMAEGGGL